MNTQDELTSIRQREQAATAGPWKAKPYWIYDSLDSRVRVTSPTDGDDYNTAEMVLPKDAEFIAHARTDIPRLLGALDAVLALHQIAHRKVEPWATGYRWTGDHCAYDGESWPCRTVAAVNKALEASK